MQDISKKNIVKTTGLTACGGAGLSMFDSCSKEEKPKIIPALDNEKWKHSKCVQIGDSITWFDGNVNSKGEKVKGYATYLRDYFGCVDNMGVAGACIAYHQESQYEDVVQTVDKINFKDYDFCTIAAGINDCQCFDSELGSLQNDCFDKTTFFGGYQYILNKILTSNPYIKILIITPLKTKITDDITYRNNKDKKLIDYVDAIKEIASYYSLPVLDFYSISGFNNYTFDLYTSDGTHPNNDGYKMLSSKLLNFVFML